MKFIEYESCDFTPEEEEQIVKQMVSLLVGTELKFDAAGMTEAARLCAPIWKARRDNDSH